jgi:hypothetical protein
MTPPRSQLSQRLNHFERLARLHPPPVRSNLCLMLFRPLPDQTQSRLGTNVANHHPTGEIELSSLPLMLRVKVRRLMLVVNILMMIPKNIEIAGILLPSLWPNY